MPVKQASDFYTVMDWDWADPVLGVEDVARGRSVACPTTFYLLRNRDRSGVMGVIDQNGHEMWKRKSTSGQIISGVDEYGQAFELEICWDGAQSCPESKEPIGFADIEELKPVFREHSKGLLLGAYGIKADNWDVWRDE